MSINEIERRYKEKGLEVLDKSGNPVKFGQIKMKMACKKSSMEPLPPDHAEKILSIMDVIEKNAQLESKALLVLAEAIFQKLQEMNVQPAKIIAMPENPKPRQWRFEIERNPINGRIQEILAKEITGE